MAKEYKDRDFEYEYYRLLHSAVIDRYIDLIDHKIEKTKESAV